MQKPDIVNSHLDGNSFFWEAGPIGALLFHGFTATTAEVRPLAENLRSLGFSVSAPLLPGHGTSAQDLNQTKWQEWIEAGEKAYQELAARCEQVFIGGESAGAMVSLFLASRHPEIKVILLFSPAMKIRLNWLGELKLHLAAALVGFTDKEDPYSHDNWQGYPLNPLRGVLQLKKLQREVKKRLPNIHQPIQIIQGRHDKTIDLCSGEIILKHIGSADKEFYWMENSTHVVLLDDEMDLIMQRTRTFLEKFPLLTNKEKIRL